MTTKSVAGVVVLSGLCLTALLLAQTPPPSRRISLAALEDKIRGGWAGQMIGVSYGAPTEFRSNGKIIEGKLPWTPDRVTNSIKQDDLYVEMTFAEALDRLGLDASTEQLGQAFKDSKYSLWHANAAARLNPRSTTSHERPWKERKGSLRRQAAR